MKREVMNGGVVSRGVSGQSVMSGRMPGRLSSVMSGRMPRGLPEGMPVLLPGRLPGRDDCGVEVRNLREVGDGLGAVGLPRGVAVARSGRLVGVVEMCGDGANGGSGGYGGSGGVERRCVFLDGRRVTVTGNEDERFTLPGMARCEVVAGNRVTFMTDRGAWRLTVGRAGCTVEDFTADYPRVVIGVYSRGNFSATTAPRTLSGGYSHWAGPLSATDRGALTSSMLGAYEAAMKAAKDSGFHGQPLAVRYRLLSDTGEELFRSEPLVVGDGGYRGVDAFPGSVGIDGGVYRDLEGVTVTLGGFSLGFRVESGVATDAPRVATMEIYATPMLDPVDYDGEIAATFGASDSRSAVLGLRLPMMGGLRNRVTGVLDRMDSVETRIAVVADPFGGEYGTMTRLDTAGTIDCRRASAALTTALTKGMARAERGLVELSFPHRFTAGTGAVVSDLAVWGNVIPVLARPSGVLWHGVATDSMTAWSAVTRVTIKRDGRTETVAVSQSGTGGCPQTLSPVAGYPHPGAVRLQVSVTGSDGSQRGADLKLSPSPDGSGAYYIAGNLEPIRLVDGVAALSPVESRIEVERAGSVAVAMAATPFQPLIAGQVSSGAVTAISGTARYGNALDMGRRHVALFGHGGIFMAAVNPGQRVMSCHRIDPSVIVSGACVAVTPRGIYALAAGRLLLIEGGKVKSVETGKSFSELHYLPRHDELLCRDGEGVIHVIAADGGRSTREYSDEVKEMQGNGDMLYGVMGGEVVDFNDETGGETDVAVTMTLVDSGRQPTVRSGAAWLISAESFEGTLRISGSHNGLDAVGIAKCGVSGRVNVYPRMRICPAAWRNMVFEIAGRVSRDFKFKGIVVA